MSATVRSLLLSGTACLLILGAPRARAEDATPAQATMMEAQVREAVGSLLGPSVNLAASPVKITAAGDHYDIALPIPIPGGTGGSKQAVQLTGTARPGDNGSWIVENVRTTNPLIFTVDVPVPPAPSSGPSSGQLPGQAPDQRLARPGVPGKTVPVTYSLDQQGQTGRIVWDPSFKTPSTWTASAQSTKLRSEGGPLNQNSSTGPVNAVTTLRPSGPDRVDLVTDGTLQDYQLETSGQAGAGGSLIQLGMKTVRVTSALNGISREHGAALIRAFATMGAALAHAPPASGQPPKVAPDVLKAILAALQDFASDFALDETVEGFIVTAQGNTVALDRMRIGFDARSDTGLLHAGMNLGMEGLALPDLQLGDMAALIPTHVAIHPVVGGIAVADLLHMATLEGENKEPGPTDIAALFSHGGITAGIDSMAVDVAGAKFTGEGKVVATGPSPDALSGTATITADNFDALMQKVQSVPALAQQAVPVMVFIKGIGRNVDTRLVWDISFKNNKLLVNNVDLTAMAGGPPAAAAPAPSPAAPTAPTGKKSPGTVRPLPSWAK